MLNIRRSVYLSLLSCAENGRYTNLEADSFISKNELSPRDRTFYTALLYGTTEKQITLDHQIKKLSSKDLGKIDLKVLVLLRMGLYQILFMNGVPDRAAVSETVTLASSVTNSGAAGFVNGILRSAVRQLKSEDGNVTLLTPDKEKDICGYLSITYSFPRFLCKKWISAYGEENAERIMIAQNRRPVTTLRVNTLKTSSKALLSKISDAGVKCALSESSADGIVIEGSGVASLPGFEEGCFFVQDDSSRLCVEALAPKENDTVIDCCSCPGGKSFAFAIRMGNRGKIFSCDIHDNKLSLVRSGAERLGIGIIETVCQDASVFKPEFEALADKVLCDVPCSGFGTISKKPDLRLKPKEVSDTLPPLQLAILSNCCRYVKSGGTLVYSTCTLNPDENENVVSAFLAEHGEFELISQRTFFPYEALYDGFYYAKMQKKLS
ncbi:MAG: 16S rRNA (cytosine(967)-C(5))-methyltransferase RsmB [Ruminococcaceae bacterium]|nr:16S rRNA (cytosine(967)-C(5))-methyltransferase RsmB [Oscillospiraceae bacterium]